MLPDHNGCPYLFLAPMEGVGDRSFRKAMASVGGFDEAVRDFIRVPHYANVKTLAAEYVADEMAPTPLAAQIMGSDPQLMAAMAYELMRLGAHRVDVNCGCPSNIVTGRNAGSSLLKDPAILFDMLKTVVKAVPIPVTVKMRSGFDDISLFSENIMAAQESGVKFITLHARTKSDGYKAPARWELIAQAKSMLSIPLVGNGDIRTVDDALKILELTNCDALMIGRGSVMNPFIFHQIKNHFSKTTYQPEWKDLARYLEVFLEAITANCPPHVRINKLKQIFNFMFAINPDLLEKKPLVMRASYDNARDVLNFASVFLEASWMKEQPLS